MAGRVRFNELDESAARNICSQLLSKDISCIPVPKENILLYSLGAIKNVGYEAISQLVSERKKKWEI